METRHLLAAHAFMQSALLAESQKETGYFASHAAKRIAEYMRDESGLRTYVQIEYEVVGMEKKLVLDVFFSANDECIEEASAYLGDSAIDIAPLLDWDVLCELIDEECKAQAEYDACEHACAVREEMRLAA